MVTHLTLSLVALAPLLTWVKVEVACTALLVADILFLSVGHRRDQRNAKVLKALDSARKLLTLPGLLAIITLLTYWRPPVENGVPGNADLLGFFVGLLTLCGWVALGFTALALGEGAVALLAFRTVVLDDAASDNTPEPQAQAGATPPRTHPHDRHRVPSLSPWIETYLVLSIVNLVLLVIGLLLRGSSALPGASALNPYDGIIAIGLHVFLAIFIVGTAWLSYRSSPRSSVVMLILSCVLTAVVIVFIGLHILAG